MELQKFNNVDKMVTIEKMFSEIGLDDINIQAIKEKTNFDFDFSKLQNQTALKIITTNNTKNE